VFRGMVEAGGVGADGDGLALGGDAAKDEDGAGLRVGDEEIAVGSGVNDAWHDEGAEDGRVGGFADLVALHRDRVAAGVELNLEAGGGDGPGVRGTRNDVGAEVGGLGYLRLGQICDGDLAADAGLLLGVVGEGGLAGNGLLGGEGAGEERQREGENGNCVASHGVCESHGCLFIQELCG
jgi:hypothetical protein